MTEYVSVYTFRDRFLGSDTYKNNFSYDGLTALFDYLEELEESTGEPIEFDMVALCCDYTEYSSADEAASNYFDYEGMIFDENGDETMTADEVEESAMKYLEDRTQVIKLENGGVICQNF